MRYVVSSIFLFVLAFSAVWAYRVNYDTREVVSRIQDINAKIFSEEEKFSMLEGEWAYLNRPERLSLLSEKFFNYLGLMPISAENYADIDAIKIQPLAELHSPLAQTVLDETKIQVEELK